jgi:hypothetical protein
MAENSFDIVSNVDLQEVRNAVQQAAREVATRYDLKKADARIEQEGEEIVVEAADEFNVGQAMEVLKSKLVRRGVDLKSCRFGKVEPASGGRARQRVSFQQGIPQETARKIVAEVKRRKIKVQVAIQGDQLRVSGKKRDDLQKVIAELKEKDFGIPLQFVNFRD